MSVDYKIPDRYATDRKLRLACEENNSWQRRSHHNVSILLARFGEAPVAALLPRMAAAYSSNY